MILTGFEPFVLWILSPTLYQLSHPVNPDLSDLIISSGSLLLNKYAEVDQMLWMDS